MRGALVLCLIPLACTLDVERSLGPGEIRGRAVFAGPSGAEETAAGATAAIAGSGVRVRTDAEGRFILRGVPAGTVDLQFSWDRESDGTQDGALRMRNVTLAPQVDGRGDGVDLGKVTLGALGRVRGRVVRGADPVPRARVVAPLLAEQLAGDDGTFDLGLFAPGSYELAVAVDVDGTVQVARGVAVEAKPREDVEVIVDLGTRELVSSGTVRGAAQLWNETTHDLTQVVIGETPAAETAVDGTYATGSIPAGVYSVVFRNANAAPVALPLVVIAGDTRLPTTLLAKLEDRCGNAEADEADSDGDGASDDKEPEACRCDPTGSADLDADGICDGADQDDDGDGIDDVADNCLLLANADQADDDHDGQGNTCDPCTQGGAEDEDADGVCAGDNCPFVANPDQADADDDGVGDACPPATGDLTLASAVPEDAATRVSADTTVRYRFDEELDPDSLASANVRVLGERGVLPSVPSISGRELVIAGPWPAAMQVRVRIGTGLASRSGRRLAAPLALDFRVAGDVVSFDTGYSFTCATRRDGTAWCWGDEGDQLGNGRDGSLPGQVGVTTGWELVAAGQNKACGLRAGALYCWGYGDLAGTHGVTDRPTRVGTKTDWTRVSVGDNHACAIDAARHLFCWGEDREGAVGLGALANRVDAPTQLGTDTWTSTFAGHNSTCSLRTDGTLWCHGRNADGQTGRPASSPIAAPEQVAGTWKSVALGERHGCGVSSAGELFCWGNNEFGSLGNGTQVDEPNGPVRVGAAIDWLEVSAGGRTSCGLRAPGSLWCWGKNEQGQAGLSWEERAWEPHRVDLREDWRGVAVGENHVCALDGEDALHCFGQNERNQVGHGSGMEPHVRARVAGEVVSFTTASRGTCYVDTAGARLCSGHNGYADFGTGDLVLRTEFAIADAYRDWRVVEESDRYGCGLRGVTETTSAIWCWGNGNQAPVEVAPAAAWTRVSTGDDHACALTAAGALWCWGANWNGQLGTGTTGGSPVTTAVEIAPGSTWRDVSAGESLTCGVRGDGTFACWGRVDGIVRNTPTDFATGTWEKVRLSDGLSCAIAGDGTLHCWGAPAGTLGDGSTTVTQTPVQLGTDTWSDVDTAWNTGCAIRTDGALFCWGENDGGRFGDGTEVDSASLLRAGTRTDWVSIHVGDSFTCAVDRDGDAWCSGNNYGGELGDAGAWAESPQRLTTFPTTTCEDDARNADDTQVTARLPERPAYSWPARRETGGRLCGTDADWLKVPAFASSRVYVWVGVKDGEAPVSARLVDAGGTTLASGEATASDPLGLRLVHDVTNAGEVFVELTRSGGPVEYAVDTWALDAATCPGDGPYQPNDSSAGPWYAPARNIWSPGSSTSSAGFFNVCEADEEWIRGDAHETFPSVWTVSWPAGCGTPEVTVFDDDATTPLTSVVVGPVKHADGGRVSQEYAFPDRSFYPYMRVRRTTAGPWYPVVVMVLH